MATLKMGQFAIIGAGNVGKMLLERLRIMGVPANALWVYDTDMNRAQAVAASVGATVFELAKNMPPRVTVWLLCSGPKTIVPLIEQLRPFIKPGDTLISFAAAVPLTKIEALVPEQVNVARIMPNMPSLVGRGMNPVSFSERATKESRELVFDLLEALGGTIEVLDEQMNWCAGLSGAAMRSVLPVIAGLIRAGIEAGFNDTDARLIAAQVVLGTASLVKHTTMDLEEIKSLTPMETIDEALVEELFYESVIATKEKIQALQKKIFPE